MAGGYIPVDTPPGTAPLPLGTSLPAPKSIGAVTPAHPPAVKPPRTKPVNAGKKVGKFARSAKKIQHKASRVPGRSLRRR